MRNQHSAHGEIQKRCVEGAFRCRAQAHRHHDSPARARLTRSHRCVRTKAPRRISESHYHVPALHTLDSHRGWPAVLVGDAIIQRVSSVRNNGKTKTVTTTTVTTRQTTFPRTSFLVRTPRTQSTRQTLPLRRRMESDTGARANWVFIIFLVKCVHPLPHRETAACPVGCVHSTGCIRPHSCREP